MLKIELVPDMEHCIETVARKKHAEFTQEFFKSKANNKELEQKLEILWLFLETANFRKLRSEFEKLLIDGRNVRFTLYLDGSTIKFEMQVTQVN